MSQPEPPFTSEDLDRFVDARLDTTRRGVVAEQLARYPEEAAYVEMQQRLNARLRAKFDPVCDEPIPSALLRAATRVEAPRRARTWRRLALAAALVPVVVLTGWWLGDSGQFPPAWTEFARQAAYAHRTYAADSLRPVEMTARQQEELLSWLSERLGVPVRAPRLEQAGYRFLGGRLLPTREGPAAQLMYENPAGRRVTVYLRADLANRRDIEFQLASENGARVLFWLDGPRGYAITGALDRTHLLRIAKLVYDQLKS